MGRNALYTAAAAVALTLATAAQAQPLLDLSITSTVGGETFENLNPTANPEPFIYEYGGAGSGFQYFDNEGALAWEVGQWSVTYDTDPQVDLNFSITNTQSVPDTFVVTANLPLLQALAGGTLIGGQVNGSVLDAGGASGDGVVVTADPLYQGIVDGLSVLDLGTDNFNYSLPAGGSIGFLPSFSQATTLAGPATANNSIGIEISFTLSPGDTIAINSTFEILPLPAPGALALLGLAGFVGGRRRRS